VQRLRAGSGAIVTGIGTVIADNPSLRVRDERFSADCAQPLRVILDSRLRAAPDAQIFGCPGAALIFTASDDDIKAGALRERNVDVERVSVFDNGLDLEMILRRLAERAINDVLVEAGPTLAAAFIQCGLYDEIVCYVAPRIIGGDAQNAFNLVAPASLDAATQLEFVDVRRIGEDLRLTFAPRR
jgi:diaminohydroxyphosphoribosylaminopyrimidine deaminase/5-amino-6-(5-phosphoribosylamino)uracil reductase